MKWYTPDVLPQLECGCKDQSVIVLITYDGESVACLGMYDYRRKMWYMDTHEDFVRTDTPLMWAYNKIALGHEYEDCLNLHHPYHPDNIKAMKKYIDKIEQVVHIDVCDCFSGDVLVRAVGCDRMLVEIIEDVSPCYGCQIAPQLGNKYWVSFEEIIPDVVCAPMSENDLPF